MQKQIVSWYEVMMKTFELLQKSQLKLWSNSIGGSSLSLMLLVWNDMYECVDVIVVVWEVSLSWGSCGYCVCGGGLFPVVIGALWFNCISILWDITNVLKDFFIFTLWYLKEHLGCKGLSLAPELMKAVHSVTRPREEGEREGGGPDPLTQHSQRLTRVVTEGLVKR